MWSVQYVSNSMKEILFSQAPLPEHLFLQGFSRLFSRRCYSLLLPLQHGDHQLQALLWIQNYFAVSIVLASCCLSCSRGKVGISGLDGVLVSSSQWVLQLGGDGCGLHSSLIEESGVSVSFCVVNGSEVEEVVTQSSGLTIG